MRLPGRHQGYQKGSARLGLITAALLFVSGWGVADASAATGLKGVWIDHTGRGAIEIYDCEQALCGRLIWMKNPLKPNGEPFRDKRNSEPSLRNRTICGIELLGALRKQGAGTWDGGWIYDPERGQRFSLKVVQQDENRITVTGYLVSPVFGKSFAWTRASQDVERCAPIVEAATKQ